MSKELTRRAFLIGGGLAAGGLLLSQLSSQGQERYYDPILKIDSDRDPTKLNYEELKQFGRRMDRMYDRLPENKTPFTKLDMQEWAIETLPLFEYNGFVEQTRIPDVDFAAWLDGNSHMHIAGRSDCNRFAVISLRYANPHSAWSGSDSPVSTLVHELAHVQQDGACAVNPSEDTESTAQVMMMEVLASLANRRNEQVVRPLVGELRSMAYGAAWGKSIEEGRESDFAAIAKLHKSMASRGERYHAGTEEIDQYYEEKMRNLATRYSAEHPSDPKPQTKKHPATDIEKRNKWHKMVFGEDE